MITLKIRLVAAGSFVATVVLSASCAAPCRHQAGLSEASDPIVCELASSRGIEILEAAESLGDYYELSTSFVTQDNLAYCGVATAAMILNALGIPAPESAGHAPYTYYTQENVLLGSSLEPSDVAREGMTLEQLGELLAREGVGAMVVFAGDSSEEKFRSDLRHAINNEGRYIAVNYLRAAIGQERGGHISPLAAYSEAEDAVLVLDVSRYKYPPVWVRVPAMFEAMKTVDQSSGRSRGCVVCFLK